MDGVPWSPYVDEDVDTAPRSPSVDEDGVLVHPVVHADLQVHGGPGHPDRHVDGDADGPEIQLDGNAWTQRLAGRSGTAPASGSDALRRSQGAGRESSARPRSGAWRFSHCVV